MGLSHEMSSEVGVVGKMQDEGRLAELGYTQELQRDWGFLHNAGASFSIIVSRPSLSLSSHDPSSVMGLQILHRPAETLDSNRCRFPH